MKAKLIVVGGDAKAAEINLKLPTVIGRGKEASLTLPHPLVSRKHCEIYDSGGQLVVRDLGSLNGTYVNNQRIEQPTILPSGELLTVGTVTFRALYKAGTQAAPSGEAPKAKVAAPALQEDATVQPTSDIQPEPETEPQQAADDTDTSEASEEENGLLVDDDDVVEMENVEFFEETLDASSDSAKASAPSDEVQEEVEDVEDFDEEVEDYDDFDDYDADENLEFDAEEELIESENAEAESADAPLSEPTENTLDFTPPETTGQKQAGEKSDDEDLNAFLRDLR